MAEGYVSPIPAAVITDYRARIAGAAQRRRVHHFPKPNRGTIACDPAACRECYRERHWRAGQTRGEF